MDLDNRSVQILQAVASTVKISSKEIMEKYDLTRNQLDLSLIHISEPTRRVVISYAVFCLKKIFFNDTATTEIYTRLFVGSVRCV